VLLQRCQKVVEESFVQKLKGSKMVPEAGSLQELAVVEGFVAAEGIVAEAFAAAEGIVVVAFVAEGIAVEAVAVEGRVAGGHQKALN